MATSLEDQVSRIVLLLAQVQQAQKTEATLISFLSLLRDIPHKFYPSDLVDRLATTFAYDAGKIREALHLAAPGTVTSAPSFDPLVPTKGWLKDYIDYTQF